MASLYVEGENYDPCEGDFGELDMKLLSEKSKFIAEQLGVDESEVKLIYGVRHS
ncbi:MAG: hypothetical protein HPY57_13460 [Ignavibacteria bacterium]|nr:hypothetical protein [Ignavibacteria bacterium]